MSLASDPSHSARKGKRRMPRDNTPTAVFRCGLVIFVIEVVLSFREELSHPSVQALAMPKERSDQCRQLLDPAQGPRASRFISSLASTDWLLNRRLTCAQTCSSGLNWGEYGGRKNKLGPRPAWLTMYCRMSRPVPGRSLSYRSWSLRWQAGAWLRAWHGPVCGRRSSCRQSCPSSTKVTFLS